MRAAVVVPGTLTTLVVVLFVALLSLDVISVEINAWRTGQRNLLQAPCPPVDCTAEIEAAGLDAAQEQLRAAPEKIEKRESPQEEKPQPAAIENVSNQEEEPQPATTKKVSKKESPQKDKQPAADVKKKKKKQPVKQKYTFKMHEPGSMNSEDVEMCPGLRKADMKQADDKFNFLFILGAQKAGTTWLHKELNQHPVFVQAQKAYKRDTTAKEIRFFNYYPPGTTQDYLDLFSEGVRESVMDGKPRVFLDSTPDYLWSPGVAPRIKQMAPNAKFVILMRDPVARHRSSYNMVKTRFNKKTVCVENDSGEQKCHEEENPPPPILDKFRQERDLDMEWPEDLTGCNFNQTVDDIDKRRTWGDCWRCDYRVFDCADISAKEADAFGGCNDDPGPHTKIKFVPMTMMGVYAPQIAWWLSFFPPENFVILTSEELHDPDRVAPAMNKILKLVGYPDFNKFTKHQVVKSKNTGFKGSYSDEITEEEKQALKELTEFYDQPNKDLQTLMDTYFPDAGFNGFTPEPIT